MAIRDRRSSGDVVAVQARHLFSTFDCSAEAFTDFAHCGPDTSSDVAMAPVWAFVAGFGEKLVPNVLDRSIAAPSPTT